MRISYTHPGAMGRGTFLDRHGRYVVAAKAIKLIRISLGLTARQLGRLMLISPRTVEGWSQGRKISAQSFITIQTVIKHNRKLSRL